MALVSNRRIFQVVRQAGRHRHCRPRLSRAAQPTGSARPRRIARGLPPMNPLINAQATHAQASAPRPVTTTAEANELAAHYIEVMDSLLDVIHNETELVRAGNLSQATALEQTKTQLARLYIADTLRLSANQAQLAQISPQTMPELIRRHNDFRALLQINLTVLATAHAVSEGIV